MRRASALLLLSTAAAAFVAHVATAQTARTQVGSSSTSPAAAAAVDGPAAPPRIRVDMRKSVVETPLKTLLAGANDQAPAIASHADAPIAAPRPVVEAVNREPAAATASSANSGTGENPTVEPGDVRWHEDFDQARSAANTSQRPVLLFQMIGRLDQRFT